MAPGPREDEAAAVAAAIERFVAESAPPPSSVESIGPWQRAALLEGIGAKGPVEDSEGGERWLS